MMLLDHLDTLLRRMQQPRERVKRGALHLRQLALERDPSQELGRVQVRGRLRVKRHQVVEHRQLIAHNMQDRPWRRNSSPSVHLWRTLCKAGRPHTREGETSAGLDSSGADAS